MIVGNGDIASAIIDRPDVTFFASGVSNSRCEDYGEFEREINLLFVQPRDKHLVYFSSLCIYYSTSKYAAHKLRVETFVQCLFRSFTIVRIGNIDWGKNPNTLINYLKSHPEAEIQNTYRHILNKDEFQYWLGFINTEGKDIMNIPGRMVWVPDLVKQIKDGKILNVYKL